jgi:pyrroline-5-carboxylate reductase
MKVGIIGYGNMGSAIAKGILNEYELVIYNRTYDKIDVDVNKVMDMQEVVDQCDVVFIAVKPYLYEVVLKSLNIYDTTIISIGAGITSDFMKKYCENFVLTMPNTAAINRNSITSIVKSDVLRYEDVLSICQSFGDVVEIEESLLPMYTVLFGSSPAFYYYFIECFMQQFDVDSSLIAKHFISSSQMLLSANASVLCDNVCSEGGVSIEGVKSLRESGLENIIKNAIDASVARYEEMKLK